MSFLRSLSSPRFLGYLTLALGVTLATLLAGFVLREAGDSDRIVRVRFPEIATLSEGDPVLERGVPVGAVRRIALEGRHAVADLTLFRHGALPGDTRFLNTAHSLMGARAVWLARGTSDRLLDESRVQEGVFVPGLPETLHEVHRLTARLTRLRRDAEDAGGLGGLAAVMPALERTHAVLAGLPQPLERGAARFGRGLETAARAGEQVEATLRAAEPVLDSSQTRATLLLERLAISAARLDTALEAAEEGIRGATTGPGGRLLRDRAAYDGLVGAVETLDAALRLLREDGLGDSLVLKPRMRGAARGEE